MNNPCPGYIASDCDADGDVYYKHNYTATPEESVKAILDAGTDVDCTSFVGLYANRTLSKGLISEADVDQRLRMLFTGEVES